MYYTDKVIKFFPDLVPLIKNYSKTSTYRIGDKFAFLEVGDRIQAEDSASKTIFAELEITDKSSNTFGEFDINSKGHEAYQSKEEQRATFKKYYGKDIQDDQQILVLHFKVVKVL